MCVCVGELRKRKEERKGEIEFSEIDRIVRSFEIRTKPSSHSYNQFGISLSLIFSIETLIFDSIRVLFRLKFEFKFQFAITCLQSYLLE